MDWNSNIISRFLWAGSIPHHAEKEAVANKIVKRIRDKDVIGIGSGSTVYVALFAIAKKIRQEGLNIRVVPVSAEASIVCMQLGIPQGTLSEIRPDWSLDGADEADPDCNLIKGRGGAMFKEKLLMCSSTKTYILIDKSKLVTRLGEHFPVPVEIFPGALPWVESRLYQLGAVEAKLRLATGKDGPVITENGNWIIDVRFAHIPVCLETQIKAITGVIESGLFMGYPVEIVCG